MTTRRALQNIVDLAARVGDYAPKHPFPMKTTFRNCFLVNFSMEPEVLQRAIPKGLRPDLFKDKAFLSVVVADLEAMRPGFYPRFMGSNFTQVVYRAIVRAPNDEPGVYFVRSDADSVWMSLTGNIFSNFNFNLGDVKWTGRENLPWIGPGSLDAENAEKELQKPATSEWLPSPEPHHKYDKVKGGDIKVSFKIDPWITKEPAKIDATYDFNTASLTMPSYSYFAGTSIRDAQRYFVERYAAFKSWPNPPLPFEGPFWTAVRIDRTRWNITSVEHFGEPIYEFMQKSSVFKPGDCKLDSCFYVSDLDYHWHIRKKYPLEIE